MVLLRANQNVAVGNATFAEKAEIYKESGYSVTNQVAKCTKWSMDEIRDRQAQLAKIAVKTWSQSFME
jgi:hypothetical protein